MQNVKKIRTIISVIIHRPLHNVETKDLIGIIDAFD